MALRLIEVIDLSPEQVAECSKWLESPAAGLVPSSVGLNHRSGFHIVGCGEENKFSCVDFDLKRMVSLMISDADFSNTTYDLWSDILLELKKQGFS